LTNVSTMSFLAADFPMQDMQQFPLPRLVAPDQVPAALVPEENPGVVQPQAQSPQVSTNPRGHDCGFPPVSTSVPILVGRNQATTPRLLLTGPALVDLSRVNALRPMLPSASTTVATPESSLALTHPYGSWRVCLSY
jgi:hypothetical protein